MPDYMFLLESRLSPEQRAVMLRVQELSAALGFNVYLTGGTVRDLVTGASLRDLDFTVEGNPSKIAHELEKGGAKILHEDEKLRHVELLFAGDCEGSISAARDDHYVRPGTRPEIRWSTIMEDLRRRDFSLNAIAISLNPASRGLLLDPTNGLSDIERAEVRGDECGREARDARERLDRHRASQRNRNVHRPQNQPCLRRHAHVRRNRGRDQHCESRTSAPHQIQKLPLDVSPADFRARPLAASIVML